MNKAIIIASIALSSLAFAPSAFAAGQIDSNLHYGMSSDAVKSLQQFLSNKGYFNGPETGNFLNITESAVKAFQFANNIPATGYVGPLTLTAINSTVGQSNGGTSSFAFVNAPSGTIDAGQTQNITWTSNGNAPANVDVNLIKQVSSNPASYVEVRTIASGKPNNGSATWVPAPTDVGAGLSVEIGCAPSANACQAADNTGASLAVIDDGRYANTASAYQSIESAMNK